MWWGKKRKRGGKEKMNERTDVDPSSVQSDDCAQLMISASFCLRLGRRLSNRSLRRLSSLRRSSRFFRRFGRLGSSLLSRRLLARHRSGLGLLSGLLLGQQDRVNVGQHASRGDRHTAQKLVQLLIVAHGELQVARRDALRRRRRRKKRNKEIQRGCEHKCINFKQRCTHVLCYVCSLPCACCRERRFRQAPGFQQPNIRAPRRGTPALLHRCVRHNAPCEGSG